MKPSEILTSKRDEVLAVIARHPFANPRVFGSVARGEDTEESDVDLLGVQVDVFTPESLKSYVLTDALRDQRPL